MSSDTDDRPPCADLAERLELLGWQALYVGAYDDEAGLVMQSGLSDRYLHVSRHVLRDESDGPDWSAKVRRRDRDPPLVSSGSGMRPETAARAAGVEVPT
jgi:hypothetical protein